jgi:hypothetical protein
MRRLVITLTVMAGLVVPAVAVASRVATGPTRKALDRADDPLVPRGIPDRCLFAQVTTKDGGNWAEVGFNGRGGHRCARWEYNGVDIFRRTRGRWRHVLGGSAMLPCGRFGIPVAVQHDLHLPCAVTLPTGPPGARHLEQFLSPDGKVWCSSNGDITENPFSCVTGGEPVDSPQRGGFISGDGKVTLCYVPVPSFSQQCTQNWGYGAPILHVGQENYADADGVLCKSATNGITCTLTAGPGKGKGFFINSASVSRVGP